MTRLSMRKRRGRLRGLLVSMARRENGGTILWSSSDALLVLLASSREA